MYLSKLLIISLLILQSKSVFLTYFNPVACEKIRVHYETIPAGPEGRDGRIIFRFEGNRADYHIYILNGRNKEMVPASKAELTQLRRGKYAIVITGKSEHQNYCPEFLEIEVK